MSPAAKCERRHCDALTLTGLRWVRVLGLYIPVGLTLAGNDEEMAGCVCRNLAKEEKSLYLDYLEFEAILFDEIFITSCCRAE